MTASPITGWIENRSRWWANNINDGTEKKLFKVLADGRKAGLGTDEIAKNLREFREFQTVTRSERVARTEMTVAQGQGALESFDQAEIPFKRWFAAIDGRERDTHREASGQVRRTGELFEVGSDKMEAPGQGSQARENVNCRCVLLPEEEEPKEEPREEREEVGDVGGVTTEVPQAEPLTVSNWVPEIAKSRGVTESGRRAASNAVSQTAQSLKPALGKKMMQMWADPKRRMTVVTNNSGTLRGIHPETGKPFQAGGIYRRGYRQRNVDKTWVGEDSAGWAAHHEVGHQMMSSTSVRGMSRPIEFLGKARAQKFQAEVDAIFYKVENEGRRAVSTYSKSNIHEFMAENFKYAITAPEHLKLVDPEMLRIMQRYWVSKTPAKYKKVSGIPGPNPGDWAWIERLFNRARWGEAYRAMREVM
jgi:SPP1 gp7 family putative phage head morphogenesis protein